MNRAALLTFGLAICGIVAAEPVAITGATILTQGPAGDLRNATVVFEGGRIIAVGNEVTPPAGARIIGAAGKIVTPGFINAAAYTGLTRPPGAGDEPAVSDAPLTDEIHRAFNPLNVDVLENPVDGATVGILVPSVELAAVKQGKIFGGPAAAVDFSGKFDFLIRKNLGIPVTLNVAGAGGGRAAAYARLARQLEETRGTLTKANNGAPPSGAAKPEQLALGSVLSGQAPLLVNVDRASDILNLLETAREQKIRIVLFGAAEGWLVARQIAEAKVPVVLSADENLPSDFDRLHSTYQNAARLVSAGVSVAFIGEGIIGPTSRTARSPRYVAGRAVAYGVDPEIALKAITITPARIYGLDDVLGSVEVGKRADLVVWTADPLEVTSFVDHVFINGEEPPPPRAARLRDGYKAKHDGRAKASL